MSTWPETIVKGEDVIVFIWDAPIWKPYVCARSCAYNVVTNILETSVASNDPVTGIWKTFEPTSNEYAGSIAGIISLMQTGTLSLADLRLLQYTHTKLLMRYQRTSQAGDIYAEELKVIITQSDDDASFDNVTSFSIQFKGTGPPTQIFTVTPNPSNTCKVKRYDYTGVGGEIEFNSAALYNKDILEVVKDGLGKAAIITSGTPLNIEAKYYQVTGSFNLGVIEFAQPFEPGEKAYVLYQDI